MGLEYICIAPGFAKEVLEVYDDWETKEGVPMKVQELMMVLRVEVSRLYNPGAYSRVAAIPRTPKLKDVKLD